MPREYLVPSVHRWRSVPCQLAETGVKSFPISCNNADIILNIGGVLCPFDASTHPERETSRSLLLKLPAIWDESFEQLDEMLIKGVCGDSQKFFGAKVSEDDVIASSFQEGLLLLVSSHFFPLLHPVRSPT